MIQTADAIRTAIFDLIPTAGLTLPTHEAVAARAGVSAQDVQAVMVDEERTHLFLLEPLTDTANEVLASVPIRRVPTIEEQRACLARGIAACASHPREMAHLVALIGSSRVRRRLADAFLYGTSVRLIGMDNDGNATLTKRATFAAELIAIAVVSSRHDLTREADQHALVEACLSILHPSEGARG